MNIPHMNESRTGTILIVDEVVTIRWQNSTKAHYVSKGYKFTKNGAPFNCLVSDLTTGSNAEVLVKCPFCKKNRTAKYREIIKANHTFCRNHARINDLKGMRFGRLTVGEFESQRGNSGQVRWSCVCDCGNIKSVQASCLVIGDTTSCGCYNMDVLISQRGEKSTRWNPNISNEERVLQRNHIENKLWRKSVMERDSYACQVCGDSRGGNLRVHHLYSYTAYPEHQFDVNNGVTLCEMHHVEFHKWNGGSHVPCTPGLFQEWLYLM